MDYHLLRAFADNWVLLALALAFVGAVVFAFRPGARRGQDATADIPFRHEDRPAGPLADAPPDDTPPDDTGAVS